MEFDAEALLLTFIAETEENLRAIEEGLLSLERKPDDLETLQLVFRVGHTLKGNSASLGFSGVEEFAHELEAKLETLRGDIELPIPAASAVKIGGERAYKLARRGVEVAMPVRRSTVHGLDVIGHTGDTVTLDVRVSSGTYIRSLALELGGHCVSLRRTEVGPFSVDDAVPPEAFAPDRLLPEAEVLERV